jgi:phage-related protein
MSVFTWTPIYASLNKNQEPRVLKNNFGDGYSQRAGDGLNIILEKWTVEFTDSVTNITAIDDFLTAREGWDDFDWTSPRGTSSKYICPRWTRAFISVGVDRISAEFEEVSDL